MRLSIKSVRGLAARTLPEGLFGARRDYPTARDETPTRIEVLRPCLLVADPDVGPQRFDVGSLVRLPRWRAIEAVCSGRCRFA